jgi:hypothetical protein
MEGTEGYSFLCCTLKELPDVTLRAFFTLSPKLLFAVKSITVAHGTYIDYRRGITTAHTLEQYFSNGGTRRNVGIIFINN